MAIAVALGVAGCGLLPVDTRSIGTSVEQGVEDGITTFHVAPWPLDLAETVAYVCDDKPGPEFTVDTPVPRSEAGCVELQPDVAGGRLTLQLALDGQDAASRARLESSVSPWYLALRGRRGATALTLVTQVVNSPIPSDPGPS
ncbi:MAG TPA: hypothetical protein VGK16_09045 [Candidatus Limnocylindrales bacterium]|jgi:hypothetical protein